MGALVCCAWSTSRSGLRMRSPQVCSAMRSSLSHTGCDSPAPAKKIALIEGFNPRWVDLYEVLMKEGEG